MKNYADYMDNIAVDAQLHDKIMEKVSTKAAQPQRPPLYRRAWPLATAAALLVLTVAVAAMYHRQPVLIGQPKTTKDPSAELAIIPKWDDRTIAEKFSSVTWNGTEYTTSSNTAIPSDQIGSLLGTFTAAGYDYSQSALPEYQADCEMYSIHGIASACAVAVKFAGTDDYFPYTNAIYRPGTLGDLINDLNLRENLRINNKIYYSYWEGEDFVQMEYSLPDPNVVWTMLLSDAGLKNEAGENPAIDLSIMDCSIDVNVIGQRNIAISVTENGYLTTNILATEKRFFIGKDAVNRFAAYVLEHGSGSRLVETPGTGPVLE